MSKKIDEKKRENRGIIGESELTYAKSKLSSGGSPTLSQTSFLRKLKDKYLGEKK